MPAIKEIHNFEIAIGSMPQGYSVQVIAAPAGLASGVFVPPFSSSDAEYLYDMPPAEVGAPLFDALFTDDILVCLRANQASLDKNSGLRISLRLHDAPELSTLPWELLYDAKNERFLALSERTPINRYLPLPLPVEELATEAPLRILALLSSPVDHEPRLEVAEEWKRLQTALDPLVQRELVMLDRLDQATWPALQSHLRKSTVHILHFVGHGYYNPQAENGGLLFEDEEGFVQLVSTRKLTHLLHNHPALRLVLLNACEGAATSVRDPFAGIAQALVQQGIPAVIAMQREIPDRLAIVFGETFFAAVADGYPIDTALTEARIALFGQDEVAWAIPALFMRSADGHLFQFTAPAKEDKPPPVGLPPSLESNTPPQIDNFVGRRAEMAALTEELDGEGMVIVVGMVGVGKTALASQMAQQFGTPTKTFWYTFHQGENIHSLIWKLAGFLYWNNKPDLWQMLRGNQQSGGDPTPPAILVDYIFEMFRGSDYLLCLDDFHLLYGDGSDPILQLFVEKLRPFVAENPLRVIVVSRSTPAFLDLSDAPLLDGLQPIDALDLLRLEEISLTDDLFHDLYTRTEGNAELLHLAANALRRADSPAQVIERLANSQDIQRFLMTEVDQSLDDEERAVMNGVALLLGYPGNRDVIEEALEGRNVLRTLTYLSNRYLLQTIEGEWDREYIQHALVQAFYYDLLGRRERRIMHVRVAEYYEMEEADWLRAALHYQRAGEETKAAELALRDVWNAIHQGKAEMVRELLQGFSPNRISPAQRTEINVTLAEVLAILDESDAAQELFQTELSSIKALGADAGEAGQAWRARIYLGLGTLLMHRSPEEAMARLQEGLSAPTTPALQAALRNRVGSLQIGLADYPAALESLHSALELLPPTPTHLRGVILNNLSVAYIRTNTLDKGREYALEALRLAELIHDLYGRLRLLSNIGVMDEILGDWVSAGDNYSQALKLAEELGSLSEQARLGNLIGTLRLHQQDDAASQHHLEQAIILFRQLRNDEYVAATLPVVAQLHIKRQEWEMADASLQKAESLATAGGWEYILPETYAGLGLLSLGRADEEAALRWAEQSLAVAERLSSPVEVGKAQRVQGQALLGLGRLEDARTALESSLRTLEPLDPYETALTKLQLARSAALAGENAEGDRWRDEAQSLLRRLNPQRSETEESG